MSSFLSDLTKNLVINKFCLENEGAFFAELAATGCETQFLGPAESKCLSFRDCGGMIPLEGTSFPVSISLSAPLSNNAASDGFTVLFSDFGADYTIRLEGTLDSPFASREIIAGLNLREHPACLDDTSCYVPRPIERKQLEAQTDCEGLGGNLAIITSAQENERIRQVLDRSSLQEEEEVYIGLNWLTPRPNDGWEFWLDGTEASSYTNWAPGEPSHFVYTYDNGNRIGFEDAAAMKLDGTWNDVLEDLFELPYICEIPQDTMYSHIAPVGGMIPFSV